LLPEAFSLCKNANDGPLSCPRHTFFWPEAVILSQDLSAYSFVSRMNARTCLLCLLPTFTFLNTCEYIYTTTVSICKAGTGQLSYSCELAQSPLSSHAV